MQVVFALWTLKHVDKLLKTTSLKDKDRLRGYSVHVTTLTTTNFTASCYRDTSSPQGPDVELIQNNICTGYGRYVTLLQTQFVNGSHGAKAPILQICEFKVYG